MPYSIWKDKKNNKKVIRKLGETTSCIKGMSGRIFVLYYQEKSPVIYCKDLKDFNKNFEQVIF